MEGKNYDSSDSSDRNKYSYTDDRETSDSDPEEEDDKDLWNDKCASRNARRKSFKRVKKDETPFNYLSSRHNPSTSYLKRSYGPERKQKLLQQKRLYASKRGSRNLHPKKKMKYSVDTKSPDKNDSFPSFLKAISCDSSSESEPTSKKSEKYSGIWEEKCDFQDKDPDLPASGMSDSDSDWMQQISEANSPGTIPVQTFRHPSQNTEVITMNHPCSVTLLKYISLRVIAGGISVQGYEMNKDSAPLNVLSGKKTGFLLLTSEYSEELWKRKDVYKKVKTNLKKYVPDNITQDILSKCGNSSVIVVLRRAPYPPSLQFVELYYPSIFEFKKRVRNFTKGFVKNQVSKALVFGPEYVNMIEKIIPDVQKSKLKNSPGQRIIVIGNRRTGKSTLIRYAINKLQSMFIDVYCLDTDPGQTEFTPPGVVSLTKVKGPLIGAPFLHQKTPLKMVFTGSLSSETSPEMYLKSVSKLVDFYKSTCSLATLFVNTMGWTTGIGLECLRSIVKAVKPTILIEVLDKTAHNANYEEIFGSNNMKFYQIDCNASKQESIHDSITPSDYRNLSILSYIGRCQKPHLDTMYLNDFKPFCVCWDAIPLYISGKRLVSYRIVESFNASFVALCHVDESLIMVSAIDCFQKTLQQEPDNECLGFGIVRAVDEENHLLYIVTPLSLDELKNVNAIMKGNIMIPHAVFLEQPIVNTPLPFTDTSSSKLRRKVPRRLQLRSSIAI